MGRGTGGLSRENKVCVSAVGGGWQQCECTSGISFFFFFLNEFLNLFSNIITMQNEIQNIPIIPKSFPMFLTINSYSLRSQLLLTSFIQPNVYY